MAEHISVNNFLNSPFISKPTTSQVAVKTEPKSTNMEDSSREEPKIVEVPKDVRSNEIEAHKILNEVNKDASKLPSHDTSKAETLIHDSIAKNNGQLPKGGEEGQLINTVEKTASKTDTTLERNRELEQQVRALTTKLQSAKSRLAVHHARDRSYIAEQATRNAMRQFSVEEMTMRLCQKQLDNLDGQIMNINSQLEKKHMVSSLGVKLEALLNSDDFRSEKTYNFLEPKAGHEAKCVEVRRLATQLHSHDPDFSWKESDGFFGWKTKEGRESIISELADRRMVNAGPERSLMLKFQTLLTNQSLWITLWTNMLQKTSQPKENIIRNINR